MPAKVRPVGGGDSVKRIRDRRPAKCSAEDKAAVERFLKAMLKTASESVVRYQNLSKTTTQFGVLGSLQYWQYAEKAIRWLVAINGQRKAANAANSDRRSK